MAPRRFEIPFEWLVCPVTKTPLKRYGNEALAAHQRYRYDETNKYWNFIPDRPELFRSAEWKAWEQLQSNGMVSYREAPANNLGVGNREDFVQFSRFCEFRGNVLDIGVGPQEIPSHAQYGEMDEVSFVGLDPLEGIQPRKYTFIQGLGEFLPFRDNLFDQVLYVTSLDHFIEPQLTLEEAKRTLKSIGEICIFIGEKDKDTPKPKKSDPWYDQLEVPTGAEDPFHYKRLTAVELEIMLEKAGITVVKKELHPVNRWRSNVFYKCTK